MVVIVYHLYESKKLDVLEKLILVCEKFYIPHPLTHTEEPNITPILLMMKCEN